MERGPTVSSRAGIKIQKGQRVGGWVAVIGQVSRLNGISRKKRIWKVSLLPEGSYKNICSSKLIISWSHLLPGGKFREHLKGQVGKKIWWTLKAVWIFIKDYELGKILISALPLISQLADPRQIASFSFLVDKTRDFGWMIFPKFFSALTSSWKLDRE